MRIAMLAGEANPFCKSGGLADVILPLSVEYAKAGHDVMVVIPFYKIIKDRRLAKFERVGQVDVDLSWRHQVADVFSASYQGVTYYFINSAYYFDREKLYGYGDDGERFAYFTQAALNWLNQLGSIDIIHVHDHQVAFAPVLLKERPWCYPKLNNTKTVLTIHNPAFKGYLAPEALGDLFNLPLSLYEDGQVRFEWGVSTLKGGIIYADKITTVSPTHAQELLTLEGSFGLSGVLNLRRDDFSGIVNGIDEVEWDPMKDPFLAKPFNEKTFAEGKKASKIRLCETGHIPYRDVPAFGVVSRLTEQKGVDLLIGALYQILENGYLAFVCGSGDYELERRLQEVRDRYPDNFGLYIGFNNQFAHDIYGGCDFFLMPSLFEPCGIGQLLAKRYGTLPIARRTGGLADTIVSYDGTNEKVANGFLFNDFDVSGLLWAVGEAEKAYAKPTLMKKLIVNAMKCDHSWAVSGKAYLDLYKSMLD